VCNVKAGPDETECAQLSYYQIRYDGISMHDMTASFYRHIIAYFISHRGQLYTV